jgi:hypothetical protein
MFLLFLRHFRRTVKLVTFALTKEARKIVINRAGIFKHMPEGILMASEVFLGPTTIFKIVTLISFLFVNVRKSHDDFCAMGQIPG